MVDPADIAAPAAEDKILGFKNKSDFQLIGSPIFLIRESERMVARRKFEGQLVK